MAGLKRLGIASSIGMFLLLLTGSLVTNTGSADGCGQAWPFCDGDWTSLATFIEVNHRLVTGILGIMIAALSIGSWRTFGQYRDVRRLVIAAIFLLLLQSFLGAAAVMWGSSAAVMASHFGVSLASFGAVLLLTLRIKVLTASAGAAAPATPPTLAPGVIHFRNRLIGAIILTFVVVYIGALVRHTNSGLACLDWPLCNGKLFPGLSGAVGLVFLHRITVLLLLVYVIYMTLTVRAVRQRPDLVQGSWLATALLVSQSLTGWLIVATRSSVASNMFHAAILILYMAVLLYLAMQTTPLGIVTERVVTMPKPASASD